jgi:hypothetical protein
MSLLCFVATLDSVAELFLCAMENKPNVVNLRLPCYHNCASLFEHVYQLYMKHVWNYFFF